MFLWLIMSFWSEKQNDETNVDLSYDSQAVWLIDRESGEKEPVRIVRRSN